MSNKLTKEKFSYKILQQRGDYMKIKNLYVVESGYLKKPMIVKKPNFVKRLLALCIGAEIIIYKDAITDTNIIAHPNELYPLCKYINTSNYGKDISDRRLKKLVFEKTPQKDKNPIGF